MRLFVFIMCSSAGLVIMKNAAILLVGDIGSMYQAPDCQRYMEHVRCCIWALRRPAAAFATSYFHFLKCCNPIGQFLRLPVASVGFVFFRKKLDVDLPLDEKIVPGKFHQDQLYGVETYSEQTDRQTDILLYIYRLAEVPGVARDDTCTYTFMLILWA